MRPALRLTIACLALLAPAPPARAADIAILDVPSAAAFDPARLNPGALAFSDGSGAVGPTAWAA